MMRKMRFAALLLALSLFAGCSGEETSTEAPATEAPAATEAADATEAPAATEGGAETAQPAAEATGEVIYAEDLPAEYESVQYGMWDFETYVSLPIAEGESLSFWITGQPQTATLNFEYEDISFYRELEERTGIYVELTVAPFFSASEVFNIMVNGGDYPELISRVDNYYSTGADGAVEDEVILAMDDIVAEYMPNYQAWLDFNPDFDRAVRTVSGDIWMAGAITNPDPLNNTTGMLLRGDWLEEAGMDLPETYDEYHDVLTNFVTEHDGAGGLWLNNLGGSFVFGEGYDLVLLDTSGTGKRFAVYDGDVTFLPTSDNMREFLTMLNQWWDEGLIYSDFMSQTDIDYPEYSTVTSGDVGVFCSSVSDIESYATLDDSLEIVGSYNPKQEEGQQLHSSYQSSIVQTGGTSISTECENIELAAKWLDYMYTYDGYVLGNYGVEGEAFTIADDGSYEFTDLMLNNPDANFSQALVLYTGFGTHGIWEMSRERVFSDYQWEVLEMWNSDTDSAYRYPQDCRMTVEESSTYNDVMMDIETYVSENIVRFVIGELSTEDDWDNYVATVEGMGLAEAEDIYQTAYDRYIAG